MLLAAGRGQRMAPLSLVVGKPALDVLGRPLLSAALSCLEAACRPLVVNLHHRPRQVMAAVRQSLAPESPVSFSWEGELLGGAGGVSHATRYFSPGAVITGNADVWTDVSLEPLLRSGCADTVVLALLPHPDPGKWSSVVLNRDGNVTSILPRGVGGGGERYLFTGFQMLGERVVAALPPPPAEMSSVWEPLRREGRLRGVVVEGSWREAGTPEAYRELVVEELGASSFVHPGAEVGRDVTVERSAIGVGCVVGEGCAIVDSVVLHGARVGPGTSLVGSIVAGPVELAAHTRAERELVLPLGRFASNG